MILVVPNMNALRKTRRLSD